MTKSKCLELAAHYLNEAEGTNKVWMQLAPLFGTNDETVKGLAEQTERFKKEASYYTWLASLHPKTRLSYLCSSNA